MMMESPNFLSVEKNQNSKESDLLVGGGIGEIGTPDNVVGERKKEMKRPNTVVTEGNEAMEKSNGGMETTGDVVGEKFQGNETFGNEVWGRESELESSKNLVVVETKRDMEIPPVDDCCPICFGTFTIPCRTNCGHWFCATCILQFWNYRPAFQQCKCPICCCLINKLTPEASLVIQQEEEVVKVLKNVQGYNRLFLSGAPGLMVKVLELPLVIRRMFRGLMDPDRFRLNYYTVRFVAWFLSFLYTIGPFDFIPTGRLGIRRLFDICAIAMVVILFLVGICHRLLLRRRVRLLGAV